VQGVDRVYHTDVDGGIGAGIHKKPYHHTYDHLKPIEKEALEKATSLEYVDARSWDGLRMYEELLNRVKEELAKR
jgi:hypothetical protein